MGRPPAVIIIARHGARLDAADDKWLHTSSTPYDPPLTYGGWMQCRALGARIAALLKTREDLFIQALAEQERQNADKQQHRPRKQRSKKHRIVVHTSPFLRCLQTSIAISAGISQFRGMEEELEERLKQASIQQQEAETSKKGLANGGGSSESQHDSLAGGQEHHLNHHPYFKPRLRVDAFLGEWLTPDYYESIGHPPGSTTMVDGAKASLLRHNEHIDPLEDPNSFVMPKGNFPGGWGSGNSGTNSGTSTPGGASSELEGVSAGISKVPLESGGLDGNLGGKSLSSLTMRRGYQPPIPRSALSPSEPIPRGYVNHARDACIEIDFQWDSMRAPQSWGDGGEYGEEWSAMHRRFRRGLQEMVGWYAAHRESARQIGAGSGHSGARVLHPSPDAADDDEDTDLVLVLVTHGAGCNALIGALTNQPVLLDVALASLTMAVRKDDAGDHAHTAATTRVPSAADTLARTTATSPSSAAYARLPFQPRHGGSRAAERPPLSHEYVVSLTASTDHLTTGVPPPSLPSTPSGGLSHHSQTSSIGSATSNVHGTPPRRRIFDAIPPASALHDRARSLSNLPAPPPLQQAPTSQPVTRTRRSKTTSVTTRPSATSNSKLPAAGGALASTGLWGSGGTGTRGQRSWSSVGDGKRAQSTVTEIREEGHEGDGKTRSNTVARRLEPPALWGKGDGDAGQAAANTEDRWTAGMQDSKLRT